MVKLCENHQNVARILETGGFSRRPTSTPKVDEIDEATEQPSNRENRRHVEIFDTSLFEPSSSAAVDSSRRTVLIAPEEFIQSAAKKSSETDSGSCMISSPSLNTLQNSTRFLDVSCTCSTAPSNSRVCVGYASLGHILPSLSIQKAQLTQTPRERELENRKASKMTMGSMSTYKKNFLCGWPLRL